MYVDISKETGGLKHFLNPWTIREVKVESKNDKWRVVIDYGDENPKIMPFKSREQACDFMSHFE